MSNSWMESYWHPVGRSEEIGEQPTQFFLLGRRIVLYRNGAGVVALEDTCPHRGTALSGGIVTNGTIACPYHGWQFDSQGQCVHIPALPEGSPPISDRVRVASYQARDEYGLVWVAMSSAPKPFPLWPYDAWASSDYHIFLAGTYIWQSSAARATEAAIDFSHFNFVHKGYTELADGPVIKPYDVFSKPYGLQYAYEDTALKRDYSLYFPFVLHDTKTVISEGEGITWSEKTATNEGDITILTFIAAPISDAQTKIYSFIGRNHSLEVADSVMAEGFDEIMDQDRVVVESQLPVEIPEDLQAEFHQRCPDAASLAYRRLLSDARQEYASSEGTH